MSEVTSILQNEELSSVGISPWRAQFTARVAAVRYGGRGGRLWWWAIALLGTASCQPMDMSALEDTIRLDLQAANLVVNDVNCPARKSAEHVLRCEVELESGQYTPVIVQSLAPGEMDERPTWEIPNSRALLNMRLLEDIFQAELRQETNGLPVVMCGRSPYRLNQPGDRFECRVRNGRLGHDKRIERIVVTVDSQQNLAWQQVWLQLSETDLSIGEDANSEEAIASEPSESEPPPSIAPEQVTEAQAITEPPTVTTADELLSDPSVFDDF